MNIIRSEIIKLVEEEIKLSPEEIDSLLERPADRSKGDYSLACFRMGKALNKTPNQVAVEIASRLKPTNLISDIKVIGAYVNFFADTLKLTELTINQIRSEKENYGSSEIGKGKTVVIDYSSPNIAKPMGIGHLRSTVIGNAIYKIYKTLGYNCVGINYLGDWGTQFGMLIADCKANQSLYKKSLYDKFQFNTAFLSERYVAYNEKCKTEPALLEKARQEFKKLEEGDEQNKKLWNDFKQLSLKEFQRIYKLLDIQFEEYSSESLTNKIINPVILSVEKKGLAEISEGALVVKLDKYGMPPCLLRKSDGATLYAARDIAEAIRRYDTYKFHKMIYVVGSDQKLHFRQVFKVLELMGYKWASDCVHTDFGLVRIEGEKMSTRSGKIILLEEVLNEAIERSKSIMRARQDETNKVAKDKTDKIATAVGIGAIIFNDLKNKRTRDIDFDWEQVLSFDGETGPYLQYTHTRLASLLDKAQVRPVPHGMVATKGSLSEGKEAGYELPVRTARPGGDDEISINPELFKTVEEIMLIKRLNEFPEIIEEAAKSYEPSIISNYLLDLASVFNRFYRFHRIISSNKDEAELNRARLTLVKCLKRVIAQGLGILGITALEEM